MAIVDSERVASEVFEENASVLKDVVCVGEPEKLPIPIQTFLDEVDDIRRQLNTVEDNTALLKIKHERLLKSMKQRDIGKEGGELKALVSTLCKEGIEVEKKIAKLKEQNDQYEVDYTNGTLSEVTPSELRIRQNHTATLSKTFVRVMRGSREAQDNIKNDLVENYQLQIKEMGINNLPPELSTVQVIPSQQEIKKKLSVSKLVKEASRRMNKTDGLKTLAYIKARHDEILCIVRSIDDLSQTFVDAAILVQMQGEMINDICKNCETAQEYTQLSVHRIQTSKKLTKKGRFKKAFYIICSCMIIFVIIVCVGSIVLPILIKAAEFTLA
ncbi:syntaxin-2, putative [Entamoeba invadens IP1]|uniref:Syntaxin-2, putative n=1 Tax=Entamoeba invadens IP1 TaxID=370355 RepID=A0A0A1TX16_ENTIV|nr:syntaxin-2, putative [Entamoeba invadens IP1]ELP85835.1 syntaxin-2, putative [Entamoeba invadens IP1]|eukprot:XP_004185181.1 syntaxin-2, putative [Entamoeba invadens IP1]